MTRLPLHKATRFSEPGLHLRRIEASADGAAAVTYAHRDDYYIFGLVERGTGCVVVDFRERTFASGDLFVIRPGQMHRFVRSEGAAGWLLFAAGSFVGGAERTVLDRFSLFASSFRLDERRRGELSRLAALLAGRADRVAGEPSKNVLRRLAEAFIAVVAEAAAQIEPPQGCRNPRHVELVVALRRLLSEHLAASRRPSFYASLLHISPVYMNEVVRDVTGMSATAYIREEAVLQAKRLLIHTDLPVQAIAGRLGFGDGAYFARLFVRQTGTTPTEFRRKNLG